VSAQTIKAGDLVILNKPTPCCKHPSMEAGTVFIVDGIGTGAAECNFCKTYYREMTYVWRPTWGAAEVVPVSMLTVIEPPGELGLVEEKQEQPA